MRGGGTGTMGMMVAQTFRRNAKTTKITRMIEMIIAISTSWTEERIVVVRSTAMFRCSEGEIEARSCGRTALMRSTVSIILAAGWRLIARRTARFPPDRPRLRLSSRESTTSDIAQTNRSTLVAGDDEGLILVSLEKLVGIGDSPGLRGIGERAFCQVRVGSLE